MNRDIAALPTVLLLTICSLATGCKSEPIALGLHPEEGLSFGVALVMVQSVVEERPEADLESEQRVVIRWRQTVEEVREDGSTLIGLKYESARMSASNPSFGVVNYDSSDPTGEVPLLAIGLHAAIGEEVKLEIDDRGEIRSVPGIENFANRVATKLELPIGSNAQEVRSAIRNWFNEDAMREMMRPIFSIYPEGLVQTGDEWHRQFVIERPFPHLQTNEYELLDVSETTALVGVYSMLEPISKASSASSLPGGVRFDIEGSQEGKLLIDRASGFVLICEISQELEGVITRPMPGEEDLETPLSLEARIEYAAEL